MSNEEARRLKEQGDRFLNEGKLDDAEHSYRRALAIDPHLADAQNNLGIVLDRGARFGEALDCFLAALRLNPQSAPPCLNIANWHSKHGNHEEQRAWLERAIALKPDYFEAHNNLGSLLHLKGDAAAAAGCFKKAIEIKPDFALAYLNLARCHRTLQDPGEEMRCIQQALKLAPEMHEVHNEFGFTLQTRCEFEQAEHSHRAALALNPHCPKSRLNLAHALLQQGKYEEGLSCFEARFDAYVAQWEAYDEKHFSTATGAPPWAGEDIAGKRLLLWMEQGLGDNLMMLRYLPQLLERYAAQLLVLGRPELSRLVRNLPWPVTELPVGEDLQPGLCDYHCALTSLPHLLGTRLDTIPQNIPYLFVPPELTRKWSERLDSGDGRARVGIVWAGNPKMPRDALRSIDPRLLAPLKQMENIRFISLQKSRSYVDSVTDDWMTHAWIDSCEDFLDTAALVQNLDLVVGADTSTIHLAGALGKPVWLLNRFESEWRWLGTRTDSPWYPSMRIFRQPGFGDWESVIAEIATALRSWNRDHSQCR